MAQAEKIESGRCVVIGGSAGSLTVLLLLLPALSRDFPAPIVLVTHRHSGSEQMLELLLSSRTTLMVKEVEEKEKLRAGTIYVAPADYHLLFESDHTFSLDHSEKVHYSRPSIDVAFMSAARAYGKNLIAVLLSGANSDGVEGLVDIQEAGGITIVQNPQNAEVDYMPQHALERLTPDYIIKDKDLANLLAKLLVKSA